MDKHEILIYDVIGYDWWTGAGITAKFIRDELNKAKAAKKDVLVRINSPGGSVSEGIAIYNLLSDYSKQGMDITMQVDGIAMSMAAIIMLSGSRTTAAKNSVILLHNVWGVAIGNAQDLQQEVELMSAFDTALISTVSGKTGKTEDEVRQKWFDYKDHSLTASQAKDEGLIDSIVNESEAKLPDNISAMSATDIMAWYASAKKSDQKTFLNTMKDYVMKFMNRSPLKIETENAPTPEQKIENDMKDKFKSLFAYLSGKKEDRKAEDINAINQELSANEVDAELVAKTEITELRADKVKLSNAETELSAAKNRITELEAIVPADKRSVKKGGDTVTDAENEFFSEADSEMAAIKKATGLN